MHAWCRKATSSSRCHLVQMYLFWHQCDICLQVQPTKVRLCSEPNKVIHAYHVLILIVVIKLRVYCYGDVREVIISNSPHEQSCRSWSVCYATVSQWCRAASMTTADCWYPERTGGIHTFWRQLTWKSACACVCMCVSTWKKPTDLFLARLTEEKIGISYWQKGLRGFHK